MKLIRKSMKTLCCFMVTLLLISSINVVYPFAETPTDSVMLSQDEVSSVPDLTGGIITAISNSRFLSNLPTQTLYTGDTFDLLSGSISAVEEQQLTIEKDGISYTQTIMVDWNEEVFDTSAPGSFDLIATIVTPEGVTFAPGVLTHITIPITVIEKPEMIEITSLTDYGTITSTVLLPVSDAAIWEQTVQSWYDYYSYVWGVSDNDEGAEVVLENLDISQVDYTTPGNYTAVLSYQIADYLQDYYTLAENLQTVHIPVTVSDPAEFELVINHFDTVKFTGGYLYEPEETLEFLYIVTDKAVDAKMLDTISGEAVSETMGFASEHIFRIFVNALEKNMHYYFFGKDGETYSNYVHIYNDDTLPTYEYMEGDRDGGDSSNSQLPDYNPDLNPILPTSSPEPIVTPTPTPIPIDTPMPSDTVVTPTVKPTATPKPSDTIVTPTVKPTATPKPSDTIVTPSAKPAVTPKPSDTVMAPTTTRPQAIIKPQITKNPIQLVAKPLENANTTTTLNQHKNPVHTLQPTFESSVPSAQPTASNRPETTSQPKVSVEPDISVQSNYNEKPTTTSQSESSVSKDTDSQSISTTGSTDTVVDTSGSHMADTKEESSSWMILLIVITVIALIVIILELIILIKRRKH